MNEQTQQGNNQQNFGSDIAYGTASRSDPFVASAALKIRLDTTGLLDDFEAFLKGYNLITYQQADGRVVSEKVVTGTPLCNDLGFQSIMQTVSLMINPQSVQGNFTSEEAYEDYIIRARKDLATDLMINRGRYGIDIHAYGGIMSRIMRIIEIFMTRPLLNKERDSFAATIKTNEVLQTKPSGGLSGLNPFGGR